MIGTPLPSLSAALSRRKAIFGAVAVAAVPAAAAAAPVDQQLAALAAEICTTLDGAALVFRPIADEDDQQAHLDRAISLINQMVGIPAAGLAGIRAKAMVHIKAWDYDIDICSIADSLAEDAERVIAGLRP